MAEVKLPRCRVCGQEPERYRAVSGLFITRHGNFSKHESHDVTVRGGTQSEADARWRRMAGGEK